MAKGANQVLGFSQCVFVPISDHFRLALVDAIRMNVSRLVPQWQAFRIEPSAEYLGVLLGSQTTQQFTTVGETFQGVVLGIGRAKVSASLSLRPYNSQAITVYSFKSQILEPPKPTLRQEMNALSRVLHVPNGTLDHRTPTLWHLWGLPKVHSILVVAQAAMSRFGCTYINFMSDLFHVLRESCEMSI